MGLEEAWRGLNGLRLRRVLVAKEHLRRFEQEYRQASPSEQADACKLLSWAYVWITNGRREESLRRNLANPNSRVVRALVKYLENYDTQREDKGTLDKR